MNFPERGTTFLGPLSWPINVNHVVTRLMAMFPHHYNHCHIGFIMHILAPHSILVHVDSGTFTTMSLICLIIWCQFMEMEIWLPGLITVGSTRTTRDNFFLPKVVLWSCRSHNLCLLWGVWQFWWTHACTLSIVSQQLRQVSPCTIAHWFRNMWYIWSIAALKPHFKWHMQLRTLSSWNAGSWYDFGCSTRSHSWRRKELS